MFRRLTGPGRDAIVRASGEAQALGHRELGTGHLLLALLDERAGPVAGLLTAAGVDHARVRDGLRRRTSGVPLLDEQDADALRSVGIDLDAVLTRMSESFGPSAPAGGAPRGRRGGQRWDAAAKQALSRAVREATAHHDDFLGPEHLLLGLLDADADPAWTLLGEAGVDTAALRRAVLAALDKAA